MNILSFDPFIINRTNLLENYFLDINYPIISSLDLTQYLNNIINKSIYHLNEESKENIKENSPNEILSIKKEIKHKSDIFIVTKINVEKKEKIFEVIYPDKSDIFNNFSCDEQFKINKRFKERRKRFENRDNIRKKVKRAFLNNFIYHKINYIIKKGGSRFFIERFPQNFVADISRNKNRIIINKTLR